MNYQFNEDLSPVPYGNVPKALPSPVASGSLLPTLELPAFSASMDSPSLFQDLVDCNSLQNYQSQMQFEELAYWQGLQNQQTKMGPSASNKFELQQQHLRSMDPKLQKQESSMEPHPINPYQLQQQRLRLMEPQSLKQSSIEPSASNRYQLHQQQLRFIDPQVQQHSSIQPAVSNHYLLQHQKLKFREAELQSMGKQQIDIQPPASSDYHIQRQHMRFTETPLKIGGVRPLQQLSQVMNPTTLVPPSQPPNIANHLSNRASSKGKEKVTSLPSLSKNLASAPNQSVVLGLAANVDSQSNLHSSTQSIEDPRHHPPLPRSLDITSDSRNYPVESSALLEVIHALNECSPPGSEISNPYEEINGPIFDIPFSANAVSSGFSASNKKGPTSSRKGKEVVTQRKRR